MNDIVISSGCSTIDRMFNGGLKIVWSEKEKRYIGLPHGIFGKANIGKSLLAFQYSINAISQGLPVLYIDTELNWDEITREYYIDFLSRRFNVSKEEINKNLHYISAPTIFDLAEQFGILIEIETHGKQTLVRFAYPTARQLANMVRTSKVPEKTKFNKEFFKDMPIVKTITDNNIKLVVIDSISAPIKEAIPVNQQNFPQRSNLFTTLLGSINKIADVYATAFLIITHGSVSPQEEQFGAIKYKMWGGDNLLYYIKRWMLIYSGMKEDREAFNKWLMKKDCIKKDKITKECELKYQLRGLYRTRYPGLFPEKDRVVIERDYGYIDME